MTQRNNDDSNDSSGGEERLAGLDEHRDAPLLPPTASKRSARAKNKRERKGVYAIAHPLLLLAFAIIVTPMGVGFYYVGNRLLGNHSPVAEWSTTRGTILKTWMVYRVVHKPASDVKYFYPSVEYDFSVAGEKYRSTRQQYTGTPYYRSRSKAESRLQNFQDEPYVTVYYNPENPNESVLVWRSFKKTGWLIKVGGVVVMIFGVLALLAAVVLGIGRMVRPKMPAA